MWYKKAVVVVALVLAGMGSVSAETGNTLLNRVREMISQPDSSSSNYSNADIRGFLRMATSSFLADGLSRETTFTILDSAVATTLPSDFHAFSGPAVLKRKTQYIRILPVISPDSLGELKQRLLPEVIGEDVNYVVSMGGKVWLFPQLTTDGDTAIVPYYYKQALPTFSTEECGFTDDWEYVITCGAAAMAFLGMSDYNGYDRMVMERDKKLAAIRASTMPKAFMAPAVTQ